VTGLCGVAGMGNKNRSMQECAMSEVVLTEVRSLSLFLLQKKYVVGLAILTNYAKRELAERNMESVILFLISTILGIVV